MGISAQELAISLLAHPALFFNADDIAFMKSKILSSSDAELRELVRFLTSVISERSETLAKANS
jgi:hypothetical protein